MEGKEDKKGLNKWIITLSLCMVLVTAMELSFMSMEARIRREISEVRQEILLIKEAPKDSTTIGEYHNDGSINHEQFQDAVTSDLSKRLGNIENKAGRY